MKFNKAIRVLENTLKTLEKKMDTYYENTWETIEKELPDGNRKQNRQDKLSKKIQETQEDIDEILMAIEYLSYIDSNY